LEQFYELIPAPNEAYTNLFWLADTESIDEFLKRKSQEERGAKKSRGKQLSFSM
jgi:hypothetical protein